MTVVLSGPEHKFVFANASALRLVERDMGRAPKQVFPNFNARFRWVKPRCGLHKSCYLDFGYHPWCGLSGSVQGILFQGVDVTHRVCGSAEFENSVTECTVEPAQVCSTVLGLNHPLLEVKNEGRQKLAAEVHNGAHQWRAVLKWKIAALQEDIAAENSKHARRAVECLKMLDELSREIKEVSGVQKRIA
jgi:hypothetical protein